MVRARDQVVKSNVVTTLRGRVAQIRAVKEAEVAQIRAEMVLAIEKELQVSLPEKGTPITMRAAAVKYGTSSKTVLNWVRYGFVTVIKPGKGRGSKTYVDERDVALIVATQDVRQGTHTKSPNK